MITTINLNPCIDKSIFIENFKVDALNRVIRTREDIAGKGINVGIVLKQIGYGEVYCTGFNFNDNGQILTKKLNSLHINHDFINIEGFIRTNTKIIDTNNHTYTELNESGGFVSDEEIIQLRNKIKCYAEKSSMIVISGSIPQNVPKNIYKTILNDIKDFGTKSVIDAEGELLFNTLENKPYLIKPNLYELNMTFSKNCKKNEEVLVLAREIINEYGIKIICVSMGGKGALICNKDEAYFADALEIDVKGLQGAGDSMVAGACLAIAKNLSLADALTYGVAASAGSLIREGTLLCTKEYFEEMLLKAKITKIIA